MVNEDKPVEGAGGLEDIRPQGLAELANLAAVKGEEREAGEELGAAATEEPIAFISDIHSNLEALTTVLREIEQRGIKRIMCLGDVVGYGPNPRECLDLVMERCEVTLMGNHDFAIFFEPYNFNTAAENAAYWTRMQFETEPDAERRNRRWRFLGQMPARMSNERFCAFHGSPRRPINEYVFPDDIYTAPQKMASIFDRIPKLCFVGHTHVPGVFVPDPDFYSPEELGGKYTLGTERAMVNVGSVGQPRDRNPQASFAILYASYVEFVRVAYDLQTTQQKVKEIEALDNFLGSRLFDGR